MTSECQFIMYFEFVSRCFDLVSFNRFHREMENIFTVSEPILIIAKCFGFFPAAHQGSTRDGLFKFQFKGAVTSFCAVSYFVYLIIVNYYQARFLPLNQSDISYNSYIFIKNLELYSYLLLCVYQASRWKRIVKFLSLVNIADDAVQTWFSSPRQH